MEFKIVNTEAMQLASLRAFMAALGYRPEAPNKRVMFVTDNPNVKHHQKLSLSTAVKLHNIGAEGWEEFAVGYFRPRVAGLDMCLDALTLTRVYSERLVKNVKIQYSKKADLGVQVQSHIVELAQPHYLRVSGLE